METATATFGPEYKPEFDEGRLTRQRDRILRLMLLRSDLGAWLTLADIETLTGYPQASISAQLRHLKKRQFGSYRLEKRVRGDRHRGLWEYQLLRPVAPLTSGEAN